VDDRHHTGALTGPDGAPIPGAVRLVLIVANVAFGVASLICTGVPLSCSEHREVATAGGVTVAMLAVQRLRDEAVAGSHGDVRILVYLALDD
jgi:hypothetical protein